MASNSLVLNCSLKPAYTPKTVTSLLKDLSSIENQSKRLLVLNDYLLAHQEELSKVEVSPQSGELPQCMLLLREAIETLKEEMLKIKMHMESNVSMGQTPLMDFLASKCKSRETEEQREIVSKKCSRKANDLSSPSAQNQNESPSHEKKQKALLNTNQIPYPDSVQSWKTRSGVKTQSSFMTTKEHSSETSGQMKGGLNLKSDSQTLNYHPEPLTQSIWKNNRRAWSPELHKRFVEALNLLGGIDVATPKQIKELMQVEGLTNDQVKSHLQKFRLHYKRLSENTYTAKQLAYKQNHWTPLPYNSDFWKPSTSQLALQQLGHLDGHELMGGGQSGTKIDMGSKEGRLF